MNTKLKNESMTFSKKMTREASSPRPGITSAVLIIGIVTLMLLGGGTYFVVSQRSKAEVINPILTQVSRGEFVSQVLDQGEIQSSENVEIRCLVQARNGAVNVLEVVTEGSKVKPGDFLVRLDSTSFEKELEQQKVSVTNAQTSVIQSDAAFKAAVATLREYTEGLFIQSEKQIQNELFDAEASQQSAKQELEQAKAVFGHSTKLFSKGYQTRQQLAADEFAVLRATTNLEKSQNSIDLAKSKLQVLREITREKEVVKLTSDIDASRVKLSNDQEALKVEEQKLADIKKQIENCIVSVPAGVEGQVVYAKESSRSGNEWVLEEGASVRENQVLMRLPNPQKMEVKALINEQSITLITPGMPCSIRVDALNNTILKGVVTKVNQYAESSGWMSSSIRKYAVLVRIIDPPEELKPGMNSSVTIQVKYEPDVVQVPLQAVYGVQGRHFCLVKAGENDWKTREIKVNGDNSQVVWVKEGLEVGEQLVMNPGAFKHMMDLPEASKDERIELPDEIKSEIAAAQPANGAAASPGDQRRGGGPGGPGGGGPGGGGPGGGGPGGGGFDASAMVTRMMERYDTNSDGKIDATEMAEVSGRGADMLKGADADGDGIVTQAEMEKATQEMMKRFQSGDGAGGGPGGGGFGGGPGGGR